MKKERIENAGKPSWGLFEWNFWKAPFRWLKDVRIYRKRIKHMKKYGYSPQAKFETFLWFIDIMKSILNSYRYKRRGDGWYLDEPPVQDDKEQWERNVVFYNSELDKMLELLDIMDERKHNFTTNVTKAKEENGEMQTACNNFFKMFAKYFYGFWN